MSLRGVDVSGYEPGINLSGLSGSDFSIIKATEGTTYVNPCLSDQINSNGSLLLGFYHYADGKDATEEAHHFISTIRDYLGLATLWLDWEDTGNGVFGTSSQASWIDEFRSVVYSETGITVGIYASRSVIDELGVDRSLWWVAQYPDENKTGWNDNPWNDSLDSGCAMRQYSSTGDIDGWNGDLDLNKWEGSEEDWHTLARGGSDMSELTERHTLDAMPNDSGADPRTRIEYMDHYTGQLYSELLRRDDGGTGDGSDGDIYTRICYMDMRVRELTAVTIPAMEAAIKALASANGADPEAIAKLVSDAVQEKLDSIKVSVTTENTQTIN